MYNSAYNNLFRPCPMCRAGLEHDPVMPVQTWQGDEWYVFECLKNCRSKVWVRPFAGIKEKQNGTSFWPFSKR